MLALCGHTITFFVMMAALAFYWFAYWMQILIYLNIIFVYSTFVKNGIKYNTINNGFKMGLFLLNPLRQDASFHRYIFEDTF